MKKIRNEDYGRLLVPAHGRLLAGRPPWELARQVGCFASVDSFVLVFSAFGAFRVFRVTSSCFIVT